MVQLECDFRRLAKDRQRLTLTALQRNGVQVFLATHDYVIRKELDLQNNDTDGSVSLASHSVMDGESLPHVRRYLGIHPPSRKRSPTITTLMVERSLGDLAT